MQGTARRAARGGRGAGAAEGGRRRGVGGWLLLGLGLLLLLAMLASIAYGGVAAGGAWPGPVLGELWFRIDSDSLNLMQAVTQRYLHPYLWDPLAVTVLLWPAWAVFGGLAVAVLLLARLARR